MSKKTMRIAALLIEIPRRRLGTTLTSALTGLGVLACGGVLAAAPHAETAEAPAAVESPAPVKTYESIGEVISESIFGDRYTPSHEWQELGFRNLFSKGWDQPWTSPPTGGGGAPRHGWLLAWEGVFYRLSIATFGWQHNLNGGDGYSGGLTSFTPLNSRLEIQTDIPLVDATRGATNPDRQANFGDFRMTPRLMLSESRELTQTFNLSFRTPTGDAYNGNGVAAVHPEYQFWSNWWKGLVVRGGAGFRIPYAGDIQQTGMRSTFNAALAVGYYFTEHDFTPIGDMVWYVATNFNQTLDNRGPSSQANFSVGPGFRTHLGNDWYLLGAVDVPVVEPKPYDYQVLGGVMKVY